MLKSSASSPPAAGAAAAGAAAFAPLIRRSRSFAIVAGSGGMRPMLFSITRTGRSVSVGSGWSRRCAAFWIAGMMQQIRKGRRHQVIDHLVVCALIEGRSCEKFQILAESVRDLDPTLADFYASLVESEGNHYATYLIMARHIDEAETQRRLDYFLDLDAKLILEPNPHPMLH